MISHASTVAMKMWLIGVLLPVELMSLWINGAHLVMTSKFCHKGAGQRLTPGRTG